MSGRASAKAFINEGAMKEKKKKDVLKEHRGKRASPSRAISRAEEKKPLTFKFKAGNVGFQHFRGRKKWAYDDLMRESDKPKFVKGSTLHQGSISEGGGPLGDLEERNKSRQAPKEEDTFMN